MTRSDDLYPQQFLLDIEHPHDQHLGNFVTGDNDELLAYLQEPSSAFVGVWIFGQHGSGRTHLLRGSCLAAQGQALRTEFVRIGELIDRPDSLIGALQRLVDHGDVVAIDDVGLVAGHRELEEYLLAVYQRLLNSNGRLVLSFSTSAHDVDFTLPDLASRMRSLHHFALRPLNDEGKADLLRRRASHRGYELSDAVIDYWLARGPRELGSLLADLDTLDRTSLLERRKVTVPLLKQALGY